MEVETKFLRLFKPAALGDRNRLVSQSRILLISRCARVSLWWLGFVFPRPISQTRPISDGHPYRDKWQPSGRLPLIWAGLNFHLLTASSYCTFQ